MKKSLSLLTLLLLLSSCTKPVADTALTACLKEKKVVMFGASWCPSCMNQKKLFWKSAKAIPYFECSKDGKQVQECNDRGIMSYPTWQFPDGEVQKVPEKILWELFDFELKRAEASLEQLQKSEVTLTDKDKEAIKKYASSLAALKSSDKSPYQKLVTLTFLSPEEVGSEVLLVEKPVYISGRMQGIRPLTDIALFSGCQEVYDANAQST